MANKVLPQTIDWMLETVNPSAAGVSLRCFVEVTHVPGEVSTRLPVEVMKSFTQACISVCLCLFVYVSIVYGSACRSVLKQLNPIHHQGLWIALGAFRTSPAQSLYIEAHKPSLTTRRLKLSLNYVLKLKSLPENPAYSCVFEPENTKLFEESESKVPPSWLNQFRKRYNKPGNI